MLSEKAGCNQKARWMLLNGIPGTETFCCTGHLSAMVADDCVSIEAIAEDETCTCCWLSTESLDDILDSTTPLVVFVAEKLRTERIRAEAAEQQLAEARERLDSAGVVGIYDEFASIPDAVYQMARHIKDLERQLAEQAERIGELETLIHTYGEAAHTQTLELDVTRKKREGLQVEHDELRLRLLRCGKLIKKWIDVARSVGWFALVSRLHEVLDERDELRLRLEELEQARAESTAFWIDKTETVGWQLEQAHSQIVELERKLAAALRDTTNVADKRTDGVDSQPDIADNGEGE